MPLRSVINRLQPAGPEDYLANPNGSVLGITGVRSADGRVLAMMPQPERGVLAPAASWVPKEIARKWTELGPRGRVFENVRRWVG